MTKLLRAVIGIIVNNPEMIIPLIRDSISRVLWKEEKQSGEKSELLQSVDGISVLVKQYRSSGVNSINYFNPLISDLRDRYKAGFVKIEDLENVYGQLEEPDVKILFLRILYEAGCFNDNLMKQYVKLSIDLPSTMYHSKFWMIQDMSEMVFRYPEYVYDTYYTDRKRSILSYRDSIPCRIPKRDKLSTRDRGRYAIVVNGLTSQSNAVSYLVYKYANELSRQGKQVAIFPNDSLYYNDFDCIVKPIKAAKSCSAILSIEQKRILDSHIIIFYPHGLSSEERIHNTLIRLCKYNPDVVIDAAGQGSFFPVFLKNDYPIVHLTFNGYMVGTFFDKYISKCKQFTMELNKIYHAIEEKKIEEILIGFEYKAPKKTFYREAYGLQKDDFIYITVGNRLDVELKDDFISIICDHMIMSPKCKWLIVGTVNKKMFRNFSGLLDDHKIIFISYEDDLTGLYTICDAYLNPNRTGGGTSIFWAMHQGIPIVTTDFRSDILPAIGIENAVKGGYSCFHEYMSKLENNDAFYKEKSALMLQGAAKSNIEQYISSLIEIADSTVIQGEWT